MRGLLGINQEASSTETGVFDCKISRNWGGDKTKGATLEEEANVREKETRKVLFSSELKSILCGEFEGRLLLPNRTKVTSTAMGAVYITNFDYDHDTSL